MRDAFSSIFKFRILKALQQQLIFFKTLKPVNSCLRLTWSAWTQVLRLRLEPAACYHPTSLI